MSRLLLKNFLAKVSKKKRSSSKAFSLIEISVVILIIGILVAAMISAKILINKSIISSAQSKTKSSPINSIPDATIWLESSLESSFLDSESSDGSRITGWNDIKSASTQAKNNAVAGASSPTYSNTINGIHAVRFNSTADSFFNINGSNISNSDYTIFVLEKRQDAGSNYFLGDPANTTSGGSILLGYSADGTVIHSHDGVSGGYTSSVDSYSSGAESPRIFTFIQNSSIGKVTYINGFLAGSSTDTSRPSNISSLKLGKGYDGEIGEFVVFTRALKGEERKAVERYLQEKWRMDIKSISTDAAKCDNGAVVTAKNGCDKTREKCSTIPPIAGVDTIPSYVDSGSGSITCNNVNYSGAAGYTCANGVFTLTGSCTHAAPCNSVAIAGISNTGNLAHLASSSSSCNATGYNSSTTLSYTCDNGSLRVTSTPSSCSCATNFTGSTCNQCATGFAAISTNPSCTTCATGYVSNGSGGCRLGNSCPAISSIIGSTNTVSSLSHGQTRNITCNGANFDGTTRTYTCNDGVSTGAACNTCASGYFYSSGTCIQPPIICSGGTKTCIGGGTGTYCTGGSVLHVFSSSGTLSCSTGSSIAGVKYLAIGAGGSGGNALFPNMNYQLSGGGGGQGQISYSTGKTIVSNDNIVISVGSAMATTMNGTLGGSPINLTFDKGGNGGNGNVWVGGGKGSPGGNAGGGGGGVSSIYDINMGSSSGGSGSPNGYSGEQDTSSPYSGNGGDGGGNGLSNNITGSAVTYGGGGRGGSSYRSYNALPGGSGAYGCGGGGAQSQYFSTPHPGCPGAVIISYSY